MPTNRDLPRTPLALAVLISLTEKPMQDRKSTRLNSSHSQISYAVFCLKKKRYRRHAAPGFVVELGAPGLPLVRARAERLPARRAGRRGISGRAPLAGPRRARGRARRGA